MKRPLPIAGLAITILLGAVSLVGVLLFFLFHDVRSGVLLTFEEVVIVSAGLLLMVWFLVALALGLWELSIDAWWALFSFLVLWVVVWTWGTISDALRGFNVEWGVFWTSLGALGAIYMLNVRRFFNGPLSLNTLAMRKP